MANQEQWHETNNEYDQTEAITVKDVYMKYAQRAIRNHTPDEMEDFYSADDDLEERMEDFEEEVQEIFDTL